MQAKLHENPGYGVASLAYAPLVDLVIKENKVRYLLDYGAGKCRLKDALKEEVKYTAYEPSNELWASTPGPTEFVACIDVLEHIEPELLDNVLDDLQRVTMKYGLFTIHTGPAVKVLPDGRNAHLIIESPDWWRTKILSNMQVSIVHEHVIVVDKSHKWPGIVGQNYDVVVTKL